jgi:hypothetical protein
MLKLSKMYIMKTSQYVQINKQLIAMGTTYLYKTSRHKLIVDQSIVTGTIDVDVWIIAACNFYFAAYTYPFEVKSYVALRLCLGLGRIQG